MTYCLGMLLDAGLILMSDTRTNAGVDNFSTYKKMHCLVDQPDRVIYVCSAGNLSVTQSVVSMLKEAVQSNAPEPEASNLTFPPARNLANVTNMFRAAEVVSEAAQAAARTIGRALNPLGISAGSSLLLGGRIGDAHPELFLIYDAGNFIQCRPDQPFFQIGETKYGRPILDRVIRPTTPLGEAVKIGCLSFDGTIASNLGVARPIDLTVVPTLGPTMTRRIEADDAYFNDVSKRWADMLHDATLTIPDPPFMGGVG